MAVGACLVGCPSLAGLGGGAPGDDGGATDGSPDARDAGRVDAAYDASVDGGYDGSADAVSDASVEAADGGRDGASVDTGDSAPSDGGGPTDAEAGTDAGRFCASQAPGYLLCSDFDLPDGGVDQGFDLPYAYNGGAGNFGFDTTNFVSPPRSAQGIPNGFPAGGTAGIQLSGDLWSLESTPASVTCSVQWMPISQPTTAGVYSHILFLSVYADEDASSILRGIGLNLLGDGTLQFLDDVNVDPSHNTTNDFGAFNGSPAAFTSVQLSLASSGTTTTYAVTVGSVSAQGTLTIPLPATSHVTLGVGPAYFAGATTAYTSSWIFDYDNIVCR
jgi:hypothetical protein